MVGLDGFNSESLKPIALQYIEKIIQTETFLIVGDFIYMVLLFHLILFDIHKYLNYFFLGVN